MRINRVKEIQIDTDRIDREYTIVKCSYLSDMPPMLSDSSWVQSVTYQAKKTMYLLIKKGKAEALLSYLPDDDQYICEKIPAYKVPRKAIYNLFLNNLQISRSCCLSGNLYYIYDKKASGVVDSIHARFQEDEEGILLTLSGTRFTKKRYHLSLPDKYAYYKLTDDGLLQRVDARKLDEEMRMELFIRRGLPNQKASHMALSIQDPLAFEETKLGFLYHIHQSFKALPYFREFEFQDWNSTSYENEKLYRQCKRGILSKLQGKRINIICPACYRDKMEYLLENSMIYECPISSIGFELRYGSSIEEKEWNLCVVEKKESSMSANEQYHMFKKQAKVTQCITCETIDDEYDRVFKKIETNKSEEKKPKSPVLTKILVEFLIKDDLFLKQQITLFDCTRLNASFPLTFYNRVYMPKGEDEEMFYYEFTIDGQGHILYAGKLKNHMDICSDIETMEFQKGELNGIIVNGEGSQIAILKTNQFIIPNLENIQQCLNENARKKESLIKTSAMKRYLKEVQQEVSEDDAAYIEELLQEGYLNLHNVTSMGEFLEYFHEKKSYKARSAYHRKLKEVIKKEEGISFVGMKSKKVISDYMGDTIDIAYVVRDEESVLYSCGYRKSDIKFSQNNLVAVREVRLFEGEMFFKELLDMMCVPFVVTNGWTVVPFPFKYLREAVLDGMPGAEIPM